MNKKFLSILLILAMVVFLFTGCGKKDSGGNTSLEGTWRINEENIGGEKLEYPLDLVVMQMQPYFQFGKDNGYKQFMKVTMEGFSEVKIEAEGSYTVTGNIITITYTGEDADVEHLEYKINGETLTLTAIEEEIIKVIYKLVKVPDSEVAGAVYP